MRVVRIMRLFDGAHSVTRKRSGSNMQAHRVDCLLAKNVQLDADILAFTRERVQRFDLIGALANRLGHP